MNTRWTLILCVPVLAGLQWVLMQNLENERAASRPVSESITQGVLADKEPVAALSETKSSSFEAHEHDPLAKQAGLGAPLHEEVDCIEDCEAYEKRVQLVAESMKERDFFAIPEFQDVDEQVFVDQLQPIRWDASCDAGRSPLAFEHSSQVLNHAGISDPLAMYPRSAKMISYGRYMEWDDRFVELKNLAKEGGHVPILTRSTGKNLLDGREYLNIAQHTGKALEAEGFYEVAQSVTAEVSQRGGKPRARSVLLAQKLDSGDDLMVEVFNGWVASMDYQNLACVGRPGVLDCWCVEP